MTDDRHLRLAAPLPLVGVAEFLAEESITTVFTLPSTRHLTQHYSCNHGPHYFLPSPTSRGAQHKRQAFKLSLKYSKKVRMCLCLSEHYAMKTYGGVDV
jgi:hypothetical protein